jgi:uncharacterized protein
MKKNLCKESFFIKESQCTVISECQLGIEIAVDSMKRNRQELEEYIRSNSNFLYSLKPVVVPEKPLVAKMMAGAALKAGVGPMAAVAGAMADLAVADMTLAGCKVAVVEDGGEIAGQSDFPIDVALSAGDEPLSKKFGFRLTEFPIGIATSSGQFSHALSFGDAEAATVFCKNATLADAAATAIGNLVKGENVYEAIKTGIKRGLLIKGVEGMLIMYKGQIGTAGKLPQIIKIEP